MFANPHFHAIHAFNTLDCEERTGVIGLKQFAGLIAGRGFYVSREEVQRLVEKFAAGTGEVRVNQFCKEIEPKNC